MRSAWKVFTRDLRPPVRGGAPVWEGALPFDLPGVDVDASGTECGAGWHACATPAAALRIAGLWRGGRPSRLFRVEALAASVVERGDKLRAATWRVVEEADEATVREAVRLLSSPFGDLADEMAAEQVAWRVALARPRHDRAAVEAGLRAALSTRGLPAWTLRSYPAAWVATDAMDAWEAVDARAAWEAVDAWAARDARVARKAWAARDARAAMDAMDAWVARDAMDARDARDALIVYYASRHGWVAHSPDLLTAGVRDAYAAGLAVAAPVAPATLGWVMEEMDRG